MRVLVVSSYEDSKAGTFTAVLELPEGRNKDEVFREWYNKNHTPSIEFLDLHSLLWSWEEAVVQENGLL